MPTWDVEGRVVLVRKRRLTIVNVYAVNGTAKPWFDESGRVAGDRHALKRRVQAKLMDLGRDLRHHGGVVMAGDWNVPSALRIRTLASEPRSRTRAREPN